MAIKFEDKDAKKIKPKQSAAKREKKNKAISETMSGERPKVTLPKFSWDKDK